MGIIRGDAAVSELEREIELEMDDELEGFDDNEAAADGPDEEAADDDGAGGEFETGDSDDPYVERFMEIAARQFESEYEVDQALNEVLDEVAREHLFGSIWRKARHLGQSLARNRVLGGLVRKGLSVASGQFPALKAAMQLAKGNLQGALVNLGKQALGSAIPGGTAALGALSALGIGGGSSEMAPDDREVWQNYSQIAREAFEHLANNVTERADQPIEASRLAANAFQHAVGRAQARGRNGGLASRPVGGSGVRKITRYRLERGEKLIVSGPGSVVVRGA